MAEKEHHKPARRAAETRYRQRNADKGIKRCTVLIPIIYLRELRAIAYDMRAQYKREVLKEQTTYTEQLEVAADKIIDAIKTGKNVNRFIQQYKDLRLNNGVDNNDVKRPEK